MAEEEHSGGNPMETLLFVLLALIVLGALWVKNGGPERAREKNPGVFINPLPPLGDGQVYGPPGKATTTNQYPAAQY